MPNRILTYAVLGGASVLLFLGTAVLSSGRPMSFAGVGGLVVQGFKFTTDGGGSATTSIPMASIFPSANNTWDLGSALLKWRNLFVGAITTTDITITGTCTGCSGGITFPLSQSVTFSANNTYDLGQSTSSARDVYASGTAYLSTTLVGPGSLANASLGFFGDVNTGLYRVSDGQLRITSNGASAFTFNHDFIHNTSDLDLDPNNNNSQTLGSPLYGWGGLYVSSTAFLSGVISSGSIMPSINNTLDLGTPTSSFRDVYTSGTLYAQKINANQVTSTFMYASSALSAGETNQLRYNPGTTVLSLSGPETTLTQMPRLHFNFNGDADTAIGYLTYSHDNLALTFDAYHNGSTWVSSDAGSNFALYKVNDEFIVGYNAGTAKGTGFGGGFNITNGVRFSNNGRMGIGVAPSYPLEVLGTASSSVGYFGLLRVPTLLNCDTIDTDVDGDFTCGSDATGGAGGFGGHSSFHIFPTSNNTFDLGFTTSSWKDIYASGTVYIGGNTTAENVGIRFATTGTIKATATETARYAALALDTTNDISNAGRLFSIRENGSELAWFNGNGGLEAPSSTFSGNVRVGSELKVGGSIFPQAPATSDLGSSSLEFVNTYSGTFFAGTGQNISLSAAGLIIQSGSTNNSLDIGNHTRAFRNVYVSSTIFASGILSSGSIIPSRESGLNMGPNNVWDIGAATSSFRDFYSSGTIYSKSINVGASSTITLQENASLLLNQNGTADGKYSGITIPGTAGEILAFGDIVYLSPTSTRWVLADADATSTAGDVLIGMAVQTASADGKGTLILLSGTVRADAVFPAMTTSSPLYISTTAGDIQLAQPSGTDDVIQRAGFAITPDEIFFNPSSDYLTHI